MSWMKLLVLALLASSLYTFPASAEHHRDHAIVHLDNACEQLGFVEISLNRWEVSVDGANPGFFTRMRYALRNALRDCEEVADMLEDGEDLDIIRRRLSQPTESSPTSTVGTLFFALYGIAWTVVDTEDADYDSFHRLLRRLEHGWRNVDLAIWHVNDAIREEIYDDPDFQ